MVKQKVLFPSPSHTTVCNRAGAPECIMGSVVDNTLPYWENSCEFSYCKILNKYTVTYANVFHENYCGGFKHNIVTP